MARSVVADAVDRCGLFGGGRHGLRSRGRQSRLRHDRRPAVARRPGWDGRGRRLLLLRRRRCRRRLGLGPGSVAHRLGARRLLRGRRLALQQRFHRGSMAAGSPPFRRFGALGAGPGRRVLPAIAAAAPPGSGTGSAPWLARRGVPSRRLTGGAGDRARQMLDEREQDRGLGLAVIRGRLRPWPAAPSPPPCASSPPSGATIRGRCRRAGRPAWAFSMRTARPHRGCAPARPELDRETARERRRRPAPSWPWERAAACCACSGWTPSSQSPG